MKYGRMSEEEFLSRLNRIDAHVRHLNALLSDVTFINKAERYGHAKEASTDLTLIDLPQFFAHMVEEIHMAYPDHQRIQIAGEGSVISVRLNLILFQQIVVNLLSNAVKYSPPESAVLCHYICTQTSLTLSIHDKGIGIPPEDQTNLFSPFYRATNVGGVSGTGLGLAIVKRAVDAMKGEITFESAVGMGTTFVISLPLGNTL
jgi:signal transduction histidine kinase